MFVLIIGLGSKDLFGKSSEWNKVGLLQGFDCINKPDNGSYVAHTHG
jgi:hypothetical protein